MHPGLGVIASGEESFVDFVNVGVQGNLMIVLHKDDVVVSFT